MALMIEDEAPLNIHGKYDRERKRKGGNNSNEAKKSKGAKRTRTE